MGYNRVKNATGEIVTLEKIEELYGFLQGREVDGITCQAMPLLSEDQAFSVIYFLQEHMDLLPDYVDQCLECKTLVNSESEGFYKEEIGTYCDSCSVHISENV